MEKEITIEIPLKLMHRVVGLLGDITLMKPGFEIYENAKILTKDLITYLKSK
jgi:hypothetical protein